MSCICPAVHHQPTAASAKRSPTSASLARAAANAGSRPPLFGASACAAVVKVSSSPGELGRHPRLPLVFDAERVDAGPLRLRGGELGSDGMGHAGDPDGLPRLAAEGHDVLDLEVDLVTDADAVVEAVLDYLDGRLLDAEHLAHERREPRHRAAELAA